VLQSPRVAKGAHFLLLMLAPALLAPAPARAQSDCAKLEIPGERLRCYDMASGRIDTTRDRTVWEQQLLEDSQRQPFDLTTHRPNYVVMSRLEEPPRAFGRVNPYDKSELKFQLSLKAKVSSLPGNNDVWVAYTQDSYWQVLNAEISRPFRETNHEPEIYVTLRSRDNPYRLSATSIGVVHQSNGQGGPTSRSWNRVYADLQFLAGKWKFNAKPWIRFREKAEDDDNRDIDDYLGHYELRASYTTGGDAQGGGHTVSLMLRNIFDGKGRYNAELSWAIPVELFDKRLRVLLQIYDGYGENLIDYDVKATRVALGVLLSDF
jgi:phospholipase A1/A2